LLKPAWTFVLVGYWDDRHMSPHTQLFFVEMKSCELFFFFFFFFSQAGLETVILLSSASPVAWDKKYIPLHPAIG
jgi:hypothetical protein